VSSLHDETSHLVSQAELELPRPMLQIYVFGVALTWTGNSLRDGGLPFWGWSYPVPVQSVSLQLRGVQRPRKGQPEAVEREVQFCGRGEAVLTFVPCPWRSPKLFLREVITRDFETCLVKVLLFHTPGYYITTFSCKPTEATPPLGKSFILWLLEFS
jgi:hypothetical protein